MCGIAGILSFGCSFELDGAIRKMTNLQAHRGPDGEGHYIDGPVALGHRRLSIIDLEGGHQPMCNENGRVWISFNGEIYNFQRLRHELEQKGHRFKSHSDTEVIIHGYEEWGTEVVGKLRGMFAFGLVDLDKEKILLARDPFGIKPLVYRIDSEFIAFSSEINALKTIRGNTAKGAPSAIDIFLRYGYIPYPLTIYEDIRKLPPGNLMEIAFSGAHEIRRYWDFHFTPDTTKSAVQWMDALENVVDESVQAHTISDVPYGVLLSGGIDSTLVASSLKKYLGYPSKAFCMDFADKAYSELPYAQKAAQLIGHDMIVGELEDVDIALLKKIVFHYGEPFGDSSSIPTWGIAKLVRQHVPLVLTGDGGDELFAGYVQGYLGILSNDPWFRIRRGIAEKRPRRIASGIKELLLGHGKTPFQRYVESVSNPSNREVRRSMLRPEFAQYIDMPCQPYLELAERCQDEPDFLSQIRKLDILYYLPNDILTKVDIATMAHGLEARPPLIDVEVFGLGSRIPSGMNFSYQGGFLDGKKLFKAILKNRGFDQSFLMRSKKGFTVPKKSWLKSEGKANAYLRQVVKDAQHPIHHFIHAMEVDKLLSHHEEGKDHSKILWYVLVLSLWIEQNNDVLF